MKIKSIILFSCLFLISCTQVKEQQMRRDARAILELVEGKSVLELSMGIMLGSEPEFLY